MRRKPRPLPFGGFALIVPERRGIAAPVLGEQPVPPLPAFMTGGP